MAPELWFAFVVARGLLLAMPGPTAMLVVSAAMARTPGGLLIGAGVLTALTRRLA